MKTSLLLWVCLTAMVGVSGCDGIIAGMGNGFQNSMMLDAQMRQQQPMQIIQPNQNNPYNPNTNPNYWQEQRARQEYFNSLQPGLFDTGGGNLYRNQRP